jgi:hypothetical protein
MIFSGVAEWGSFKLWSDDEEFNLASSRLDISICFQMSVAWRPPTSELLQLLNS